jgi:hypothetical protein
MAFNFLFGPRQFSVFKEGDERLITRLDAGAACFSVNNWVARLQTDSVTMGFRVMTPNLVPPWNRISIFADATARGHVEASVWNGYARASVEARVRVTDTSGRVLAEAGPALFGGSSIEIPWFWSVGFDYAGNASPNALITASIGTAPLIVEARISSGVTVIGPGNATANITNACVNAIRVFSL